MSLPDLAGVTPVELLLIWLITVGASVLRSFTGFGFALAAVPIYAFFLAPTEVVVLCASLVVLLGVQTFPQYYRAMDLPRQWPVLLAAVPGTLVGALLLRGLAVNEFRLALGVITVVASLVLTGFHPARRVVAGWLRALTGFVSGVLGGAFAVPGPPIIVYVMASESDAARSRSFMIGFFSFTALLSMTSFSALGWVTGQTLLLALLAYPAMYLGDRVGTALFRRHGNAQYRRIAVATCLAIGVAIILRALL